jgi:hypothetical protein
MTANFFRFSPLLALLIGAPMVQAEDRSTWFPFVVPSLANERTAGTPIDLSWLNPGPAGEHGHLRADGERLVDGRGQEVRLFGSNICDWHAVMPKEKAEPVARRLRELGMNFIRLHYFDWTIAPYGIFSKNDDGLHTIDPAALDRLHYLVAQLKQNGIYVDINLHVARNYPGQPPTVSNMGKGIDKLHQPYVELQKQYARDILSPVNPYTGFSLAKDPAVAIIELNNENTTFHWPFLYAGLPEEFSGPLRKRWNEWLAIRYGTSAALRAAWQPKPVSPGPELLRTSTFNPARRLGTWTQEASGGGEARVTVIVPGSNAPAHIRWNIAKAGSSVWSHQLHQASVPVKDGESYVLSIEARADAPRPLSVGLLHQQPGWARVAGPVTINLTPEWQTFQISLPVADPAPAPTRLSIDALNIAIPAEFRSISLRSGTVELPASLTTLDERSVPLAAYAASLQHNIDWFAFLRDQEIAAAQALRAVVKDELGSPALVYDTQVDYGGLHGLLRDRAVGDMLDAHMYPDHPDHIGTTLDNQPLWSIKNHSYIDQLYPAPSPYAFSRLTGRPFGSTEYDLNPPNDHAAESLPVVAALASFQSWSFLADYSWLNFQQDYNPTRIQSSYATTGHVGQMATIPSTALFYRLGLVAPARSRFTMRIPELAVDRLQGGSYRFGAEHLAKKLGLPHDLSWRQGVAIEFTPGDGEPVIDPLPALYEPTSVVASDTGEIEFTPARSARPALRIVAPAYRLLIGRVATGDPIPLGDVTAKIAPGPRGDYAHLSLVALDSQPLANTKKALLTVLARVENRGMLFNEARTTTGSATEHGDGYGEGPSTAEPVSLQLKLPGADWKATPLDGEGQPKAARQLEDGLLQTRHEDETIWYLLTRP